MHDDPSWRQARVNRTQFSSPHWSWVNFRVAIQSSWQKFLVRHRRLAQAVAGWGFWYLTSWIFDNILYVAAIAIWGPVFGGGVMTVIAMGITFCFMLFYERGRTDWLGVNAVEEIRRDGFRWVRTLESSEYRSRIIRHLVQIIVFIPRQLSRLVLFLLRQGDVVAFLVLSIQTDPFITTAFLRHGRFDGLRRRDWIIFAASGLLSNFYWTLRSWGIVIILQFFLRHVWN